ncbi:MAG: hypothetical protein K8S55_01825 [Phycisphaerae bacterium]|nr:hypothetical protein [Phycisphaerae bacterium]
MRSLILLFIPVCALVAGCPVPDTPETPVTQWRRVDPVTGNGFYLYVPNKYSHDKPMPVLISCHGTPPYDVSEHHIRTWKWYGERYGCIIVCPDLEGTDGIFGAGPVDGMLINERRILSILSMLGYQYNLDRANMMITGFSGGGFPAYWVGLRHPDVFSVIVAQNCNFSRSSVDGWYPPEAVKTPVMIYYGESDPGTIVVQSQNAIKYLRSRRFNVTTKIIPGGHDRHPEVAMAFFQRHLRTPVATMKKSAGRRRATTSGRRQPGSDPTNVRLRGPRPPTP